MTHVFAQHKARQCSMQGPQRTLVLRSTHSSQLRVGLFLFCFFFGGASPGVSELDEASGLVEVWTTSSFMVRSAHTPSSVTGDPGMLSVARKATISLRLHGCHARALCDVTGISEVMLFPRAPEGFRGRSGDFRGEIQPHCQGGPPQESRTMSMMLSAARRTSN